MIIKSKLKLQRKVLFEKKKTVYRRTVADIFKSMTDDCKIMYDPDYKARFFLYKNNQRLLSVLTHGKNKTIVIENNFLLNVMAEFHGIKLNYTSSRTSLRYRIFDEIHKFVKQYGYILKNTGQVKYQINKCN